MSGGEIQSQAELPRAQTLMDAEVANPKPEDETKRLQKGTVVSLPCYI